MNLFLLLLKKILSIASIKNKKILMENILLIELSINK
jgi:hypothetical protein